MWQNTGNGFVNATPTVAPGLPGVNESSVAWGDYDNDGGLDFLLKGWSDPNTYCLAARQRRQPAPVARLGQRAAELELPARLSTRRPDLLECPGCRFGLRRFVLRSGKQLYHLASV